MDLVMAHLGSWSRVRIPAPADWSRLSTVCGKIARVHLPRALWSHGCVGWSEWDAAKGASNRRSAQWR